MTHAHIQQRIVSQYRGKRYSQYQPNSATARVWQKLTPERVVELLDDVSARPPYLPEGASTKYLASQLLRAMLRTEWTITAAPHQGGKHGSTSKDENLHITVRVGSTGYHLRCKEAPALHIIEITDGPPEG